MTKINLVDLDYENIRASLLEYLKKQDTVKDLNFEGSAVNFLLDFLALEYSIPFQNVPNHHQTKVNLLDHNLKAAL